MPPAPLTMRTRLEALRGVGRQRAAALAALGVFTVADLVRHLPSRVESEEAETHVRGLAAGRIGSVRGEITAVKPVRLSRRPRLEAVLHDGTGRLEIVWFNALYLHGVVVPGARLRVQGRVERRDGALQMVNPRHEVLPPSGEEPGAREARVRPVYPASESLTSRQVEGCVRLVLPEALPLIEDHLDDAFRAERALPPLSEAYRMMHRPQSEEEWKSGRRRLAYDELLMLQLAVHLKRAHLRQSLRAPPLRWGEAIDRHIRERLPFELTAAQTRVVSEVAADLTRPTPANRLIQGDVGSGKTIVALYAMLMAVASGHQAALMAPTELLAEQHFASLSRHLSGSRVAVDLLTGATPAADRELLLSRLAGGRLDIVIGTHALLTERVRFHSLAVAVIDEQHRFGVHQRARLREKGGEEPGDTDPDAQEPTLARPRFGASTPDRRPRRGPGSEARTPHVLVMTATPIPRTLAISLFGDLDVSTIDEMPPGRAPTRTRVVAPQQRREVYRWARERLDRGEQAFVVLPTIEAGHASPAYAGADGVGALMGELGQGELAGKRLAALHGRLGREAREATMERFRLGQIDALVATTVVEVGVDVPNATIMIVEHAERFGLAQLHQLRGRVGRGSRPSVCVLIADPAAEGARERLDTMTATNDGFVIAERDFELRGPGEIFSTRQSGTPDLRVADLRADLDLLRMARRDAAEWIARSPALAAAGETLLRKRLMRGYGEMLGVGDVG